ncbi:MAG: hypothetical protein OEV51_01945 [Nitrospira sp.]|nr:hypothetical protein [Nitrospira sp.]
MPSDLPETYLRDMLLRGTEPFRYRSGIRMLLGLPENPDLRIAFSSGRPVPAFHYVRQPSFNDAGIDASPMFSESSVPQFPHGEHRHTAPFHNTHVPPAHREARAGGASRVVPESRARAETPASSVGASGETRKPAVTDEQAVRPNTDPAPAVRLRMDIPGVSEKPIRFPAMELRKPAETGGSEGPMPVAAVQEKKDRQPSAATEPSNPALTARRGAGEQSNAVLRVPPRQAPVFGPNDPVSNDRVAAAEAGKKRVSAGGGIVDTPASSRRASPLASEKQAAKPRVAPVRPAQHQAAEALIEQLRHRLGVVKGKPASNVQETPKSPQDEPAHMNRSATPLPQPVVIVNRWQPLRHSPPAFWERSHVGQFLRLRRLR